MKDNLEELRSENEALKARIKELESALKIQGSGDSPGILDVALSSVLNYDPLIIWAVNMEGKLILATGMGLGSLGFSPGQLVGKSLFELEEHFPNLVESARRGLEGAEFNVTFKLGERAFESHFRPLRGKTGDRDGTIAVSIDVTESNRIQSELRQSEDRLRQVLDLVPHMIFCKDERGEFIFVNQAVADVYGTTVEDLVGRNQLEIHPVQSEVDLILKDDRRIIESGERTLQPETEFTDAKGELHILEVLKIPFHASGAKEGTKAVLGVASDITELKKVQVDILHSEEKYRHLVENSHDIIFVLDPKGVFLTVNRAIQAHLGYRPDEVQNKNLLDFVYHMGSSNGYFSRRQVVEDLLMELNKTGKPAEFMTELRTLMNEPYEFNIRLEKINLPGGPQIYGKASRFIENILIKYREYEKQRYVMGNQLSVLEVLSRRVTSGLSRFFNAEDVADIIMGAREILLNAIEHGNLNIKFEEKTQATNRGNFIELLQERLRDPRYRDQQVIIDYNLSQEGVEYIITDAGEGFDYKQLLERDLQDQKSMLLKHGRGLVIASRIFDVMEFNAKGNRVRLVKYTKKGEYVE